MPTHEERLTILEYDLKQYKTETIKAYGEMAIETIMVRGLIEDAVKGLSSLRTQFEQRFERVVTRLLAMNAHFGSMETRLDRVETRLDQMDTHLDRVNTHLGSMDTHLDRVENMLAQVLARLPENP